MVSLRLLPYQPMAPACRFRHRARGHRPLEEGPCVMVVRKVAFDIVRGVLRLLVLVRPLC